MRTGGTDPKIPAGSVVQQDPTPGSHVRRQRSIHVWVSQGEEVIVVPSLVGDTERSAAVRLAQGGLKLAGDGRSAQPRLRARCGDRAGSGAGHARRDGRVAGQSRRRGVSYVMPDLIGVDGDRAAELLRDARLPRRGRRHRAVPGRPAGIVIRQTPAGGFQVGPGEADRAGGEPMSVRLAPSISRPTSPRSATRSARWNGAARI